MHNSDRKDQTLWCHFFSLIKHRYDEIIEWWGKLAEDNADIVKYEPSIGKSFEGRDQPAIHITASEDNMEKTLYFQCQIHASKSHSTCRPTIS